ncbi:site-specific integrase [Urechidicola vernalis]|uniref:Site-specific integrase n=1 Tax=Urechidicola vernalis TaxID=3075600 RepID=A0ABU2Y3A2_9FLAO|nr:site-specific integrase [Urechidicola sp. P050]MDT0552635.1 site-specific integrase [Urechidicola sp. P050]
MKTHKLNIRYVLKKNKTRVNGTSPLQCRITYLGKRKQFATGQFVHPKNWFSKLQIVKPPNDENNNINTQLSLIKSKINRAFLLLQVKEEEFDVDDIYNQFVGKRTASERTLLDAFDYHIDRMQQLVGIEVKQVSVDKYHQSLVHVKSFLKFKFNKRDYLLKDLKLNYLTDFEHYLKTEKKFLPNSVYKTIQRLKRVVRVAVGADYLAKDPFALHKANKPKIRVVFLSVEELKAFETHKFTQPRLQLVQDCFIFSCYTGLAYNELKRLSKKHIVKGFDGQLWIEMIREKTKKEIAVPLLLKARELIGKYSNNDEKIFPLMSNQRYNSYLKEMASLVGIEKRLTTHTARKTFASTVLLYNNVPMEIVCELLGHSSISTTTESYGKVIKKKVSDEVLRLNDYYLSN